MRKKIKKSLNILPCRDHAVCIVRGTKCIQSFVWKILDNLDIQSCQTAVFFASRWSLQLQHLPHPRHRVGSTVGVKMNWCNATCRLVSGWDVVQPLGKFTLSLGRTFGTFGHWIQYQAAQEQGWLHYSHVSLHMWLLIKWLSDLERVCSEVF